MNKKAQIPTILAFIIALALSSAALYVMISFKSNLETQSKELVDILSEIDFLEQYIIEQAKLISEETINSCFTCSKEELHEKFKSLAENHNLQVTNQGNFYGKIRNDKFEFLKNEDKTFNLNISNLFVTSGEKENKITRNFNISLRID